MHRFYGVGKCLAALALLLLAATGAGAQDLSSFGVLAGSTVTNTGSSVINGNVGVSPGTAIVGFDQPGGPGIIVAPFTIHANDGVAIQAQIDLVTAFNDYSGRPSTANLTGQDLGGIELAPGVYTFDTSAQLTGTVTLNGLNNPDAVFIFNIGSTLTTASNSTVSLINGAQGANVFFVVGSSATLGTDTDFAGNILALTSITLNTGADIICGSALARNGAVTLDSNTISVCVAEVADTGDDTPDDNEVALADLLDALANGGDLPEDFLELIALLTPEQLQVALAQLAGQAGTAVAPAGTQAMDTFLSQVFDRLGDDRGLVGDDSPVPDENIPAADQTAPQTVRVLGYGPDETQAGGSGAAAFGVFPKRNEPALWSAWAAGYGGRNESDGDGASGSYDRTIRTSGIAAGIDFRVLPNTKIGVAIGAGRSDFELADGFGGGDMDTLQATVYGRHDMGQAYVAGAVAYSWNDVSTERFLTVGGSDRFAADFTAHDVAARVEAGYRFALPEFGWLPGSAGVTPYAGLQVQSFRTPSYSETADSGPSVFALDYDAHTTRSTHVELGARFDKSIWLESGAALTLRSGIAWAHDSDPDTFAEASFQSVADSGFIVQGADSAGDSLLLSAGAEIAFAGGFSALGMIETALAENSQNYEASAKLRYSW